MARNMYTIHPVTQNMRRFSVKEILVVLYSPQKISTSCKLSGSNYILRPIFLFVAWQS